MSTLSSEFAAAETGVFWDVDDCPIPSDLTPALVYDNMRRALENMGYSGKISIYAYSVGDQVGHDFESAKMELICVGDGVEKVNLMLSDVFVWGLKHRNEPTNLMVISEDISEDEDYVSGLVQLSGKENNLLLAHPENTSGVLLQTATSIWLWKSLSAGDSPLDGHCLRPEPLTLAPTICSACTTKRSHSQKKRTKPSEQSITSSFSSMSTKFAAAKTGVFWDLDECPIPTDLTPASVYNNIKVALEKMGYTGEVLIFAFSGAEQSQDEFESAKIQLKCTETRHAKLKEMTRGVYFWGMQHRCVPTNLLVISSEISEGSSLFSALTLLKKKANNLLLAHPHNTSGVLRHIGTSVWLWKSLSNGSNPLDGHCMRPVPASPSPSPACSLCSIKGALRLCQQKRKSRTNEESSS